MAANETSGLIFGVRAEDVQISTAPEARRRAAPTIFMREPLGDEITYDLQIGEQIVRAKAPPTLRLAVGDAGGRDLRPRRAPCVRRANEQAIF